MPIVFLTAHYALHDIGRLRRGLDRALIDLRRADFEAQPGGG